MTPDQEREYQKRYRAEHAGDLREYFRRYHEKNRAARNERMRQYRRLNVGAERERNRAWILKNEQRHRDYQAAYQAMRRARVAGLPATFIPEEWDDVLDLFGHKCAYCGSGGMLHRDHFIPVKRGGGYELGNIVPACHSCNSKKNAKDPVVWLGLRRWLDTLGTMYAAA